KRQFVFQITIHLTAMNHRLQLKPCHMQLFPEHRAHLSRFASRGRWRRPFVLLLSHKLFMGTVAQLWARCKRKRDQNPPRRLRGEGGTEKSGSGEVSRFRKFRALYLSPPTSV